MILDCISTPMLLAALSYAARGWPIFPVHTAVGICSCGDPNCENAGKHPRTKHGLHDASSNQEIIRSWWGQWPTANIGIATGKFSGLIVVDIDSAEGKTTVKALLSDIEVSAIPRVRTGKLSGFHLYFSSPAEPIPTRTRVLSGVDIRGDGGYVIAPPSLHASGKQYQWEIEPCEKLPPVPGRLLEKITAARIRDAARTRFDTARALEGVPEGQRDDTIFRLACKLRHADIPREYAEALIRESARNCNPPFSEALAMEKVDRVYTRYSPSEHRVPGSNSFRPVKDEGSNETNFTPVSAAAILSRPPQEIDWLWSPYIPAGALLLLVAYMKVGKSTFLYPLALAIARGEEFLESGTRPGGVLILALEEHGRDVENRLRKLGLTSEDHIYVHCGPLRNCLPELEAIRKFILEKNISLVFIDSLTVFWDVHDENDNAAVAREIKPLLALARVTGSAVCLVHHERKTGGEGGRNIRGGSALFGLVDQALMLEVLPGAVSNRRILKTLGRYSETPKEQVIELKGTDYELIGSRDEAGRRGNVEKVLQALTAEVKDVKTIAQETLLPTTAVRTALKELLEADEAVCVGDGRRGSPYRFSGQLPANSFRLHPSSKGERKKSCNSPEMPSPNPLISFAQACGLTIRLTEGQLKITYRKYLKPLTRKLRRTVWRRRGEIIARLERRAS